MRGVAYDTVVRAKLKDDESAGPNGSLNKIRLFGHVLAQSEQLDP